MKATIFFLTLPLVTACRAGSCAVPIHKIGKLQTFSLENFYGEAATTKYFQHERFENEIFFSENFSDYGTHNMCIYIYMLIYIAL